MGSSVRLPGGLYPFQTRASGARGRDGHVLARGGRPPLGPAPPQRRRMPLIPEGRPRTALGAALILLLAFGGVPGNPVFDYPSGVPSQASTPADLAGPSAPAPLHALGLTTDLVASPAIWSPGRGVSRSAGPRPAPPRQWGPSSDVLRTFLASWLLGAASALACSLLRLDGIGLRSSHRLRGPPSSPQHA